MEVSESNWIFWVKQWSTVKWSIRRSRKTKRSFCFCVWGWIRGIAEKEVEVEFAASRRRKLKLNPSLFHPIWRPFQSITSQPKPFLIAPLRRNLLCSLWAIQTVRNAHCLLLFALSLSLFFTISLSLSQSQCLSLSLFLFLSVSLPFRLHRDQLIKLLCNLYRLP